jgi:hypothetical protein
LREEGIMETLIRELESLRHKPQLTNSEIVGVMVATTARLREILGDRMVGIQALASAVAMQPEIDAARLHDDFLDILKAHFETLRQTPSELKDIAAGIRLAAAERN